MTNHSFDWLPAAVASTTATLQGRNLAFDWSPNDGATDWEIEELESLYGYALDPTVYEFLRHANGARIGFGHNQFRRSSGSVINWTVQTLLSTDGIRSEKTMWTEVIASYSPDPNIDRCFVPMIPVLDLCDATFVLCEATDVRDRYRYMILDHDAGPFEWRQSASDLYQTFEELLYAMFEFASKWEYRNEVQDFFSGDTWKNASQE